MAKKLTAATVAAAKSAPDRRQEIPDAGAIGLYLVIQPSGAKSWAYRYRFDGKPKKLTLGKVNERDPASGNPQIGGYLSLGDARRLAAEQRHLIDQGFDPVVVEEERKVAATREDAAAVAEESAAVLTDGGLRIEAAVDDYLKRVVTGKLKTAKAVERSLRKDVLPHWRGRRVDQITDADVVALTRFHVDRGAPIQANRILAYVKAFFEDAARNRIVPESPAARAEKLTAENKRDRVLSNEEIAALWATTRKIGYPFGPMAQLLLLTGQRLSEVAGARHKEFDWGAKEWLIPKIRVKNGRDQLVPITPHMEEIISRLPRIGTSGLLFTTSGKNPVSGFDKAKRRINKVMTKILFPDAEEAAEGAGEDGLMERWTFHDLRRTAATTMARIEVEPHVIEAVLNHATGKITGLAAVYNVYSYRKEKRAALEKLDGEIINIVGGGK